MIAQTLVKIFEKRLSTPKETLPVVVSSDEMEDLSDGSEGAVDRRIDLEDIYCMIEYTDSAERWSRRRVNFRCAYQAKGNWIIQALCHERKALRTFRADRLKCVIDLAGEIYKPENFFVPLGLPSIAFDKKPEKKRDHTQKTKGADSLSQKAPGVLQRSIVRDEVRILAALSRSDGKMEPSEVNAIVDFILNECDIAGISYTESDILAIRQYTLNLRPTSDKVEESAAYVFADARSGDVRRSARFRRAVRTVIDADNAIDAKEFEFIIWLDEWAQGALSQ